MPEPPGLPPVYALAAYAGSLRRMLIQYKERNRHELTPVLGGLLAEGRVRRRARGRRPGDARARCRPRRPRPGGASVTTSTGSRRTRPGCCGGGASTRGVAGLLRALPKREDSVELSAAERALAARQAFAVRGRRPAVRGAVVLVDDIITTGSTLAASTARLAAAGVRVDRVAVLAATQREA